MGRVIFPPFFSSPRVESSITFLPFFSLPKFRKEITAVTSPEIRRLFDIASVLVLLIVVPAYIFCRLGLILLIAVPTAYIFCCLRSPAD